MIPVPRKSAGLRPGFLEIGISRNVKVNRRKSTRAVSSPSQKWAVHTELLEESKFKQPKECNPACGAHQLHPGFHWVGHTSRAEDKVCACLPITRCSRFAHLFFPCCSHVSLSDSEFPAALFSHQCTDFLSWPCIQHWGSAAWFPDSTAPFFPAYAGDKTPASSISHAFIEGGYSLFPFQKAGQVKIVIFNWRLSVWEYLGKQHLLLLFQIILN